MQAVLMTFEKPVPAAVRIAPTFSQLGPMFSGRCLYGAMFGGNAAKQGSAQGKEGASTSKGSHIVRAYSKRFYYFCV